MLGMQMKRLFRGRLEIEELELRIPPSAILGFFLPGIEIAAEPLSDVSGDFTSLSPDESLAASSEIFDSPTDIPIGFESLEFGFHLESEVAYDAPDGLDFIPSLLTDIPPDFAEVVSIPLLGDAGAVAAIEPLEAQVEVIPLPKTSLEALPEGLSFEATFTQS